MKIKPINNHLLVEVQKVEKTKSGIHLPTDNDARYEKAIVIAVDEQIDLIKKGDSVYFKLYSLSSVEIDGKEYHFIKADEVLGIEV